MGAYLPYLEQLAFSALIIIALSDPMARVVPLSVVAPDSTYTAKPTMKESASDSGNKATEREFLRTSRCPSTAPTLASQAMLPVALRALTGAAPGAYHVPAYSGPWYEFLAAPEVGACRGPRRVSTSFLIDPCSTPVWSRPSGSATAWSPSQQGPSTNRRGFATPGRRRASVEAVLIWIIVAVIPIALLGSVLGTSRSGRRRGSERPGADETEPLVGPTGEAGDGKARSGRGAGLAEVDRGQARLRRSTST